MQWFGDSDVLGELRSAVDGASGIMLRMAAYDTMYFNGPYFGELGKDQFPGMLKIRELYLQYFRDLARYERGELEHEPPAPCNRAYSRVVGRLGVWDGGAFRTVPGGRVLGQALLPNQPGGSPTPVAVNPQAEVPPPPGTPAGAGVPFGGATVERDQDFTRITVDLIAAIPELNSTGEFAPYGAIELGIEIDGTYHPLATLVDDASVYEPQYLQRSGVVDVSTASLLQIDGQALTADQFDANPLVITCDTYAYDKGKPPSEWTASRAVALSENQLNAQTDTRALYVNEPAPGQTEPATVFTIDVRERDALPVEQVGLVVAQYSAGFELLAGDSRQLIVWYQDPTGTWLEIDNDTVVDATSGTVTIGLSGATGDGATTTGALPLVFFYPVAPELVAGTGLTPDNPVSEIAGVTIPNPGGPPVSMTAACYAAVRLHPYDSHVLAAFNSYLATDPDIDEVNAWVFQQVYETFDLMYPVMSFIGTPKRFQAWRGRILDVTDPAQFNHSAYMPPTRTLSAGKRAVLQRYDEYLSGAATPGHPLRTRSAPSATVRRR